VLLQEITEVTILEIVLSQKTTETLKADLNQMDLVKINLHMLRRNNFILKKKCDTSKVSHFL
ncbi:hypothetical protein, partial [uncultured Clostridium sp.]|uniref:hypothetical protein n=1 Tax=uncultured Clostridium sp. TaxID=59620 RepID=UPI0026353A42